MPLIRCTHCGASGNAPDHILGQQVRCSKCKKSFLAASEEEQAPEPSPFSTDPPADEEGFPTQEDVDRPASRRDDDDEDEADDDDSEIPRRPIRKPARGFGDLLMFRRMIAPYLIILLFWLLLALTVFGGLGGIIMGLTRGAEGLQLALASTILLIVGPIAVRLWCEVLIVVFRINETLTDIRNELHRGE